MPTTIHIFQLLEAVFVFALSGCICLCCFMFLCDTKNYLSISSWIWSKPLYNLWQIPRFLQQICSYWSDWASWSQCSATCSGGTYRRSRVCVNDNFAGDGCSGQSEMTGACNTFVCCINVSKLKLFKMCFFSFWVRVLPGRHDLCKNQSN